MKDFRDEIYSENPEQDIWRELLQFTYEANIIRWQKLRGCSEEDEIVQCISGSFLQAVEYYKAAVDANLQIAPLLLYYGTTNLLYGMSCLTSGERIAIENHGMKLKNPGKAGFIADTGVHFLSPENGGVHVAARAMGFEQDLTAFGDWTLKEFFDSLAEIRRDFCRCYDVSCGKTLMLDVFHTPDGDVQKIYYTAEDRQDIQRLIGLVENFDKNYLPVTCGVNNGTGEEYFILRKKLNGKDISEISYSGQPYLRAAHEKNSKLITLPTLLNMYVALFILASLCRYYPAVWNPFVRKDMTGERLLIEKFLYYARRMIPEIVLKQILKKNLHYVSSRYQPRNTIRPVGEHEIQEFVKKEVHRQTAHGSRHS